MQVYIHRKYWFDFFLREQLKLLPKYYFVQLVWNWFSIYDREAVQSDIFLTLNIQILHKLIVNQLCVSDYYQYAIIIFLSDFPSLTHGYS